MRRFFGDYGKFGGPRQSRLEYLPDNIYKYRKGSIQVSISSLYRKPINPFDVVSLPLPAKEKEKRDREWYNKLSKKEKEEIESHKKHLEDILEELEEEKQKWDLFSDWLLRCLKGEKKTKQYPYQIFNELNFAINFEKLKCFSNESKAEIIRRIEKNFTRNRTFTFTYTKKQRFNRHLLGQYEFQKLRGVYNQYFIKKNINSPYAESNEKYESVGFTDAEIRKLQKVFEWMTRKPSDDQRTTIRRNVGIGKNWNGKLCWDYHECYQKINGIIPSYELSELRTESIESCVDVLIRSIVKKEIEFDSGEIILLTKTAMDFLCKKIIETKITSKPLQKFSKKLEEFLKDQCESNFRRLNTKTVESIYEKLQETQTDWGKIQYLFKRNRNGWISKKIENETLEFKESFFHEESRTKKEWNKWDETKMRKDYKNWDGSSIFSKKPQSYEEFVKMKQNFVEHRILKNICSFINTDGGKLIIGATDLGELIGLDRDCQKQGYSLKDRRKWIQKTNQTWEDKIKGIRGFDKFQNYITQNAIEINQSKKWIYVIEILRVEDPEAYLDEGPKKDSVFYVREGDKSRGKSFGEFERWKKHRKDFH
tara:strand:+ start:4454 stop:6235 length:1782 start_codon:yes stop_codon:yes gene_type:complete